MTTPPSPAQAGRHDPPALLPHEIAFMQECMAAHGLPDIDSVAAERMLVTIAALSATVAELRARAELMERRYSWLANRVLACDYGDNDQPGHVGWRIRADLLPPKYQTRAPVFMYGPSIDAAVDARLAMHNGEPAPEALPPRGEGNE